MLIGKFKRSDNSKKLIINDRITISFYIITFYFSINHLEFGKKNIMDVKNRFEFAYKTLIH